MYIQQLFWKRFLIIWIGIAYCMQCQMVRDVLVDWLTPEYRAENSSFRPKFEGKDAKRKKIKIQLQLVFQGKPQITSIVPLPLDKNWYLATIKTGELYLYNFKTKQAYLIKKFRVLTSSEQGLLGIALHPKFSYNSLLYLHYSIRKKGKKWGRISEFRTIKTNRSQQPLQLYKERVLMEIYQPYANHNGGHLEFGPDGYLYIGLGDGGWRDDPHNHGQNPKTFLGSMLRIDVQPSRTLPYRIPTDNPYRFYPEWKKEIYAIGLRNPWKYSFDPISGKLIVADVGQDQYEEISIVEKGKNYGWNIKEGFHCYQNKHLCKKKNFMDPIYEYDHSEGQSITGGYVYMSDEIPELKYKYIFGDFVQGKIWAIPIPKRNQKISSNQVISLGKWPILISTFGRNHNGSILVCDYQSGKIFEIRKAR